MERLTRVDAPPFTPAFVESIWRRLRAIEDILGEEYDLKHLKALVTGDAYTEEDMSAAYTAGFQTGMEQGEKKIERNNKAYDLQPVVRCKDCVHRGIRQRCDGRRPEWFCADGERRRRHE